MGQRTHNLAPNAKMTTAMNDTNMQHPAQAEQAKDQEHLVQTLEKLKKRLEELKCERTRWEQQTKALEARRREHHHAISQLQNGCQKPVTTQYGAGMEKQHQMQQLTEAQAMKLKMLHQQTIHAMQKQQEAKAALLQQTTKRKQPETSTALIISPSPAVSRSPVRKKPRKQRPPSLPWLDLVKTADVDIHTPEQLMSLCFRMSTRFFLHHHQRMPLVMLLEKLVPLLQHHDEMKQKAAAWITQDVQLRVFVMIPSPLSDTTLMNVWKPAQVFASVATFSTNAPHQDQNDAISRIQQYITMEKQVVRKVLASLTAMNEEDDENLPVDQLLQHMHTQSTFLQVLKHSDRRRSLFSMLLEDTNRKHSVPVYQCTQEFSIAMEATAQEMHKTHEAASTTSTLRRNDPMKVLCPFEMRGVCNDQDCQYLHARDYQSTASSKTKDDPNDSMALQALRSFAKSRKLMTIEWPLVSTKPSTTPSQQHKPSHHSPSKGAPSASAKRADDSEDGFLTLASDSEASIDEENNRSLRYYDAAPSAKERQQALTKRVEESPHDVNAWMLLALEYLDLHLSWSKLGDHPHRHTPSVRVGLQLDALRSVGETKHNALDPTKLQTSLRILKSALEIPANVTSESLWLLYLHLYGLAYGASEVDMIDQALACLPFSIPLWLRYMARNRLESIATATSLYQKSLQYLANDANPTPPTALSALLTDLILQLCLRLIRANKTNDAIDMVQAIVDGAESFRHVAQKLEPQDRLGLALVWMHVELYGRLPRVVEQSLGAAQRLDVEALAYGLHDLFTQSIDRSKYEHMAERLKRLCCQYAAQPALSGAIDVVLNNWIAMATRSLSTEALGVFVQELDFRASWFPRASFALAFVKSKLQNEDHAAQLYDHAMDQSDGSVTTVAHQLYYSLLLSVSCRTPVEKAMDKLKRLANQVNMPFEAVESMENPFEKAKAMETLGSQMLTQWMTQSTSAASVDSYVPLAMTLLLNVLLNVTVAIHALEQVLQAPSFGSLSFRCRQRLWLLRILLAFKESESTTTFPSLMERYLNAVGVISTKRQERRRLVEQSADHNVQLMVAHVFGVRPAPSEELEWQLIGCCLRLVSKGEQAMLLSKWEPLLAPSSSICRYVLKDEWKDWDVGHRILRRHVLTAGPSYDPNVLRTLVLLELEQQRVKAVADALSQCLQSDPLVTTTWELVLALEVLLGPDSDDRTRALATSLQQSAVCLTANLYGDHVFASTKPATSSTSMALQTLRLHVLPSSILLSSRLRELDLSGNCLSELPSAIASLRNLQVLNLSQNALVYLPGSIVQLTALQGMNLSHNNLKALPTALFEALTKLSVLDVRVNLLSTVPTTLSQSTSLRYLMLAHNYLIWEQVKRLVSDLTQCVVDLDPAKPTRTSPNKRMRTEEEETKEPAEETLSNDQQEQDGKDISQPADQSVEEKPQEPTERQEEAAAAPSQSDVGVITDSTEATVPTATQVEQSPTTITTEASDTHDQTLEDDGFEIVEPNNRRVQASEVTDVSTPPVTTRDQSTDSSTDTETTPVPVYQETSEVHQSAFDQVRYVMETQKKSREDIKREHPALWRQFVEQSFRYYTSLGSCVLCGRTNDDGKNQRFNTMVVCPDCHALGLEVLRSKAPSERPTNRCLW